MGLDMWLALDAVAPGLLLGQAVARDPRILSIKNFTGSPQNWPWGIKIDAEHRMPLLNDLSNFPEATTRFHPTLPMKFCGILQWCVIDPLSRKYEEKLKPGVIFGGLVDPGGYWKKYH